MISLNSQDYPENNKSILSTIFTCFTASNGFILFLLFLTEKLNSVILVWKQNALIQSRSLKSTEFIRTDSSHQLQQNPPYQDLCFVSWWGQSHDTIMVRLFLKKYFYIFTGKKSFRGRPASHIVPNMFQFPFISSESIWIVSWLLMFTCESETHKAGWVVLPCVVNVPSPVSAAHWEQFYYSFVH